MSHSPNDGLDAALRAHFKEMLAPVPIAERARVFAGTLFSLPIWIERADVIPAVAQLAHDKTLVGPQGAETSALCLLSLARSFCALRRFDLAHDILTGITAEVPPALQGLRAALMSEAALHLGRLEQPLSWYGLTALPVGDLDGLAAHIGAETCYALGLIGLVRGQDAEAVLAFDRVMSLAARHGEPDLALRQTWLALTGQATAALRGADPATAAKLSAHARAAAEAGEAGWERDLSTLIRAACLSLAGAEPGLAELKASDARFRRRPVPGAPVSLIHGLIAEPAAGGEAAANARGTFAEDLRAGLPDRTRALDAAGIALAGAAAACLETVMGAPARAAAALQDARQALAPLGERAAPFAAMVERAAAVIGGRA